MTALASAPLPVPLARSGPLVITIRIFPGDDRRFWWRILAWSGDVDVMHETPHRTAESDKGYATRPNALRAAQAKIDSWGIR